MIGKPILAALMALIFVILVFDLLTAEVLFQRGERSSTYRWVNHISGALLYGGMLLIGAMAWIFNKGLKERNDP